MATTERQDIGRVDIGPAASPHTSLQAEMSRAMVGLYKDLFGRGPTKARTQFAGPDTVVTILEDSLTPAERSLAEMGEHQRLRDVRMFFQHATEDRFRETVEGIFGRRVRSFVSGIDTRTDTSVETFILEPTAADGPSSD